MNQVVGSPASLEGRSQRGRLVHVPVHRITFAAVGVGMASHCPNLDGLRRPEPGTSRLPTKPDAPATSTAPAVISVVLRSGRADKSSAAAVADARARRRSDRRRDGRGRRTPRGSTTGASHRGRPRCPSAAPGRGTGAPLTRTCRQRPRRTSTNSSASSCSYLGVQRLEPWESDVAVRAGADGRDVSAQREHLLLVALARRVRPERDNETRAAPAGSWRRRDAATAMPGHGGCQRKQGASGGASSAGRQSACPRCARPATEQRPDAAPRCHPDVPRARAPLRCHQEVLVAPSATRGPARSPHGSTVPRWPARRPARGRRPRPIVRRRRTGR